MGDLVDSLPFENAITLAAADCQTLIVGGIGGFPLPLPKN
jgi:hypothetical protein